MPSITVYTGKCPFNEANGEAALKLVPIPNGPLRKLFAVKGVLPVPDGIIYSACSGIDDRGCNKCTPIASHVSERLASIEASTSYKRICNKNEGNTVEVININDTDKELWLTLHRLHESYMQARHAKTCEVSDIHHELDAQRRQNDIIILVRNIDKSPIAFALIEKMNEYKHINLAISSYRPEMKDWGLGHVLEWAVLKYAQNAGYEWVLRGWYAPDSSLQHKAKAGNYLITPDGPVAFDARHDGAGLDVEGMLVSGGINPCAAR